jgi:hypothetical protein
MVVAPGGAAGVFKGRLVVIFGTSTNGSTGLFVYSPTPAKGNLIASIAAAAGTDPYGNAYLQGTANYALVSGTTFIADALLGGQVQWWQSTTGEAGPYTEQFAIGAAGSTNQDFTTTATQIAQGIPGVVAQDPTNIGSAPVLGESWHNLGSLAIAGWTVSVARYKLLADSGLVAVQIQNLAPSTHPADGTVIWSTAQGLQSGWQPSINERHDASTQDLGTGQSPSLQFQTDGSIQVNGITGTTTTRLDCYAILSTI